MMEMIFWAIIFVLTIVAELLTLQFVSIWFAIGALGAFIGAMFHLGFVGQLGIFVLVSILLLIFTRPLFNKLRVKTVVPMDADRNVGETAVVIQEINPARGTGRVRTKGVDWIAISEDGTDICENSIVIVSRVEGAKLIVRKEQKDSETEEKS